MAATAANELEAQAAVKGGEEAGLATTTNPRVSATTAANATDNASMGARIAKYPTKLRRNYPRSRNGCLTCRQRKKKCDETRPLCSACQRNGLACVWPAVRSRQYRELGLLGSTDSAGSNEHTGPSELAEPTVASAASREPDRIYQTQIEPDNQRQQQPRHHHHQPYGLLQPTLLPPSSSDTPSTALALIRHNWIAGRPACPEQSRRSRDSPSSGGSLVDYPTENETDHDHDSDTSASSVAAWSLTNSAFSAPRPPPAPPFSPPLPMQLQQRPTSLSPLSTAMLRCYIVHAAPTLSTARDAADNPFLAAVLPLAYTDDLVMHCVLALGGAHLGVLTFLDSRPSSGLWSGLECDSDSGQSSILGSVSLFGPGSPFGSLFGSRPRPHAESPSLVALHEATTRHYTCVLRSLRSILQGGHLQPGDTSQVLRTLLVLLLLAIYESASWNVLDGGVVAHLRASRQLIAWLRGGTGGGCPAGHSQQKGKLPLALASATTDERAMYGALLEIYAYLVLVNQNFEEDDDSGSNDGERRGAAQVEEDGEMEDFVQSPGMLADQAYFGHRLVGLHDLFALILPVTRCTREMRTGTATIRRGRRGRTCPALATIRLLRRRTLAWQLDPVHLQHQATSDQEHVWWRAIGEVYRNALLTYLAVAEEKAKERMLEEDGEADSHSGNRGRRRSGNDDGDPGEDESADDMSDLDDANSTDSPDPIHNHTHIFDKNPFVGGIPAAFQETLHQFIHATGVSTLDTNLASSRFISIMLWPLLVIGSILPHESARTYLLQGLRTVRPSSWAAVRAADLLEMLWKCRDQEAADMDAEAAAEASAGDAETTADGGLNSGSHPRRQKSGRKGSQRRLPVYFGPSGLARLMREQNVRLCIY